MSRFKTKLMLNCLRYILFIPLCLIHFCSIAQAVKDTTKIHNLLSRFSQIYSPKDSTISCNVSYVYTNETNESELLDSVSGFLEFSNGRSHSILGNTESVSNDSLSVTLFQEEKIMYLAKVKSDAMLQNPITSVHNLLQAIPNLQIAFSTSSRNDTISIGFPPGMEYKSIQIVSDRSTSFLEKVIYVVKTEQLADPTDEQYYDLSKYDAFAKVTASFSKYRTERVKNEVFDNSHFFSKEGSEIKAAPPYSDYKVYIGTAGL